MPRLTGRIEPRWMNGRPRQTGSDHSCGSLALEGSVSRWASAIRPESECRNLEQRVSQARHVTSNAVPGVGDRRGYFVPSGCKNRLRRVRPTAGSTLWTPTRTPSPHPRSADRGAKAQSRLNSPPSSTSSAMESSSWQSQMDGLLMPTSLRARCSATLCPSFATAT